ncbi:MAG: hypothetical protein JO033_17610 [Acidobacteriaceae bacterium]|nr:hypothetical protein [Acidobacteriaceae bacterium]
MFVVKNTTVSPVVKALDASVAKECVRHQRFGVHCTPTDASMIAWAPTGDE